MLTKSLLRAYCIKAATLYTKSQGQHFLLDHNRNICAVQYVSEFTVKFGLPCTDMGPILALHRFSYFVIHSAFAGQHLEFSPGKVGSCFSECARFRFSSTPGWQLYPHCAGILLPFAKPLKASRLLQTGNQHAAPTEVPQKEQFQNTQWSQAKLWLRCEAILTPQCWCRDTGSPPLKCFFVSELQVSTGVIIEMFEQNKTGAGNIMMFN